jgi:small subunit ribosomal protein S19e
MTTVYDIPPGAVIKAAALDLKEKTKLKRPDWSLYVKTGADKERPPENEDWWWVRAAALLRKIYVDGPVGVQRLRSIYGGRENKGRKPERFRRASGKIIRVILQEFDSLGFTEKAGKEGRRITSKGKSYLDRVASTVAVRKE